MLEILVVDDEPTVRECVARGMVEAGHGVTVAEDGEEAMAYIVARVFDVAILDIRLPKVDGLSLFHRLHRDSPSTFVILMTAFAQVRDAVEALRAGAHDYVTKPFDPAELAQRVIGPIAERHALRGEFERARSQLTARGMGAELVGSTPFAARVRIEVDAAAQSTAPLLIRGEQGTGKRLVARLVHERSPRRGHPYVSTSCTGFATTTMEGALFGYARGERAGAPGGDPGCVVAANGGTLILEDIDAMPLTCQARLLAVLRDGAVVALGSHEAVPVDVRIIATSREDLEQRVARGSFRADLLRKLGVLGVSLVPLRERPGDMQLLFEYFCKRIARGVPPQITPAAWTAVSAYGFPGNVDEMQDTVAHALALARGSVIDLEHLPAALLSSR